MGSAILALPASLSYAFTDLPPEISQEILFTAALGLSGAYFPEKTRGYRDLSLVCRAWRDTISKERQLWASCKLRYTRYDWEDKKKELDALHAHFDRAEGLPLELQVDIVNAPRKTLALLTEYILHPHRLQRLQALYLRADGFDNDQGRDWIMGLLLQARCMTRSTRIAAPFESLQNLQIRIGAPGVEAIESGDFPLVQVFPNLRRLTLHLIQLKDAQFFPAKLALPHLETLTVEIPMNIEYRGEPRFFLRDVLANAPALKFLEVEAGSPKRVAMPIVHPNLRVLVIKHVPIAMDELGTLTLPSLYALAIRPTTLASKNAMMNSRDGDYDPREPGPLIANAILRMVKQSGCQLGILRLQNVPMVEETIHSLQVALPTLRELTIQAGGRKTRVQ